ncbi:hypothetical protein LRY65_00385 [Candidatus Woesebacteria bacterium]|nr:hypothetical protein [Candidatus Woesebacteria bacterium]MCD8526663.1 hypothetical protein [Candidatus Woesebacteria bacterium]MCD8546688.1 hypothetical protein [Candidatus Woesebacteria bacterium]
MSKSPDRNLLYFPDDDSNESLPLIPDPEENIDTESVETWQDFFGEDTEAFKKFLEVATFYQLNEQKKGCFFALLEFIRNKFGKKHDTQQLNIPKDLLDKMTAEWNKLSPEEQKRRMDVLKSDRTVQEAVDELAKQIRERRAQQQSGSDSDDTRFT